MPLSPSGSKVLGSMQESYGAEKGERVFYATANKKPELGRKWHGKARRKGKGRRAPAQKALASSGRSMSGGRR